MSTVLEPAHAPEETSGAEVHGWPRPITRDLAYQRTGIVNVYYSGKPTRGDRSWVLIDAGVKPFSATIGEVAARRYGHGNRPSAIVLTHGHFDHVGALESLAKAWDVPVYAHPLEIPYLTGRASYPPADPTVGGGAMAALSWLYPRGPIDLKGGVRPLPADGTVPGMPGWRWIHTPGHSPGHVSFFRDADRTLIAGDAFITTRQESALSVLTQYPEMHGPPMYYTIDWKAAKKSVESLAALEPEVAATGHGIPIAGPSLRASLHELARDFDRRAVPVHGRYTREPAIADARGPLYIPPPDWSPGPALAKGFAIGVAAGLVAAVVFGRRKA